MKQLNQPLDVLTFAGNGEPTMHPEFSQIIDNTIRIRNKHFPDVKIAVLSNSSLIHKKEVFEARVLADERGNTKLIGNFTNFDDAYRAAKCCYIKMGVRKR